jgi:hypothetical protein
MTRRAKQAALWISVSLTFVLIFTLAHADNDDQATEALWLADHAKLVHKVNTLVIGDVDLKDVTVNQALDFLRRQSKIFDPDHQGINFVSDDNYLRGTPNISVKLRHATVENVLERFPMTEISIGDFVVTLCGMGDEKMWSRSFHVSDNVLAINPSMLVDKDKQIYDVRPLFQAKGIGFPPGAQAIYTLPAKTLTVVFLNDEDAIRVEELLVFGFKNVK